MFQNPSLDMMQEEGKGSLDLRTVIWRQADRHQASWQYNLYGTLTNYTRGLHLQMVNMGIT